MRRVEKLLSDSYSRELYHCLYFSKKKKVFDMVFHLSFAKGHDEYEVILTRTNLVFIKYFSLKIKI